MWHRAEGKWHCYRNGESLCGKWALIGMGWPLDARNVRGSGAYCTSCKKAAQRITKTWKETQRAHRA